jgi:hypothetical protein
MISCMIRCPTCGSEDCIRPAEDVLAASAVMYAPCGSCATEPPLDKLMPFSGLGIEPGRDAGRCRSCGKRHLDTVMAHVLGILVRHGLKSDMTPLKDSGTPLIVYGVGLAEPPRLGSRDLVVLLDEVNREAAAAILAEVPEVKGVLRRTGGPKKSVGLRDTREKPHVYELLAGCDMRADVVSSLLGDMVFYRSQSLMHVEFWRSGSVKVQLLENLFLEGALEGKVVVDGFASAGTLGLLAAGAGARKVVLNDAWLPAIRNILVNIEANRASLGAELELVTPPDGLPRVSARPTLVARASGRAEIEVYHADFRALRDVVGPCDVCIIDTFPGVKSDEFAGLWKGRVKGRLLVL